MAARDLRLAAAGGASLAATLFEPAGEPRGDVLVAPATAVRRGYYSAFAEHLAARGLRTLTLDYRGIGGSRPERLRGFPATLEDWAADLAAALALLGESGRPLLWVGHSFGGQAMGLTPGSERLRAAVFVASQSGWWGHWRGFRQPGMMVLWFLVLPIAARLLGYAPGRLGLGEDVPAGVARQWARWGRHRDYLLRDGGEARRRRYAELTLPLLAYGLADDGYAPPRAVDALLAMYAGAAVERRHLVPAEPVGHFGFFRSRHRALWAEPTAWLLGHAG